MWYMWLHRFRDDTRGAILVEALIVFPLLVVFCFGMFEFGSILWQREQIQVGVRDAARYWSRCRQTSGAFATECSEQIARNIAFFGTPFPVADSTPLRVPGWDGDPVTELEITPAKGALPPNPDRSDTVRVTGRLAYQGFVYLQGNPISYSAEARLIGW